LLEGKVSQIQPNTSYRRYKELARVSLVAHPDSQPSPGISLVCIPVLEAEVRKSELVLFRLYEKLPFLCC
jgi:hypothetical protein